VEQLFEALSLSFFSLSRCLKCFISSTSCKLQINLIRADKSVVSFNQINSLNISSVGLVLPSFRLISLFGLLVIVKSRFLNEDVVIIGNFLDLSLASHFFDERVEELTVHDFELVSLKLVVEGWVDIHVFQTFIADTEHLRVSVHDFLEDLILMNLFFHHISIVFKHHGDSIVISSLNGVTFVLALHFDVI
jgi:hypothetical protein